MKKMLSLLLVCLIAAGSFAPTAAEGETASPSPTPTQETSAASENTQNGPSNSAASAVLLDLSTGSVLYRKNINDHRSPTSLAKIMTVALACDSLSDNQYLTMSSTVFNSFDRSTASHLWITEGEALRAVDLEYAAIMTSANDAANMLAEGVSGSIDTFVQKMNSTVQNWGLKDTVFTNATGLPDDNQYTSAYDMALITRQAMRSTSFQKVFGDVTYEIPATNKQTNTRQIASENELLKTGAYTYANATGGKLGYSESAGYNLSATAKKDTMSLVAVVLGEASEEDCYRDTQALFEYGFSNYKRVSISRETIGSKTVEIYQGKTHIATAEFTISSDFSALLPASVDESDLTANIVVENEDDPDAIQANVVFTYAGATVGTIPMDRNVTLYDTSFRATTLPTIIRNFDWFSIGVLALFLLGRAAVWLSKRLMPPE